MAVIYEEQLSDDRQLPEDFGLLPGTLIRKPIFPRGILRDIMSWSFQFDPAINGRQATGLRGKAWARLRHETKNVGSKIMGAWTTYRFRASIQPAHLRPTFYWWRWNHQVLRMIVGERYKHFYQSLARGDRIAIGEMCLSGVGTDARKLMSSRKERAEWKLADGAPFKIVVKSNRAAPLGLEGHDGTGVQQIVVWIQSTQQLLTDRTHEAQCTEYIVMQRHIVNGDAKQWKVWGFPEAGTSARIEDDEPQPKEEPPLVGA